MNLENGVLQVHIEDIIPNRFQPRLNFDEQGLKELSDSIKEHGIIQPLVLRKLGNKFEIIAGERRYKAAQMAGLQTVPAVIANIDDNKSAEVALVENVQRRDLTAIEEARSYKSLLDKGYLTQEQLAKRMGLSQASIANKLRLLKLDDEVQQALLEEKISERHARTLLTLEDKASQREWLHRIINERLTVRQLDMEIKKSKGEDKTEDNEPLISKNKTVEEIKKSNEPVEEPEEIERLDFEPTPVVETYKEDSKDDFNIQTPISTKDLVEEESKPVNDNKFFNIYGNYEEEPKEEVTPMNVAKKELEIYIDPTKEQPEIKEEVKEEPPVEEEAPIITNTNLKDEPEVQLSSDNTFFQPPVDEDELYSMGNKKEEVIDPMDIVNSISNDSPKKVVSGKYELIDAVQDIRNLMEDLESKGFKVEIDEAALENEYDFKIKIQKDN